MRKPKVIHDLFYGPDQCHRKYHTYAHCFRVANFAASRAMDCPYLMKYAQSLYVAGIWHDAVYVPGSTDNEEQSALALLVLHPQMEYEANLIRRTTVADHLSDEVTDEIDPVLAILLDADLISLADPWEIFLSNQKLILQENGLDPELPENLKKSAEFLIKFFGRATIYRTPEIRDEYESRAFNNITSIWEMTHNN